MVFPGDDRIGSYRIERELGSTTTGILYEAIHLVLPRRAIIKVMHPSRMQQFAVQMLREACLLEALSHPGVPQVYESGMLEDRRPWFAFEWIDGITLAQRLMMNGAMTAIEVARLVRDLAAILEHAHKRGVIHRALRPDHVVLAPGRRFSVAIPDWTDARAHDAINSERAQMPSRGGRAFIAPELTRGDAADDRADVFALGVIGYQALTGLLPRGDTPAMRAPDAPTELTSLIEQMLSADRFDRPTSAEIRADLDWLAEALEVEVSTAAEPAPSMSSTLRIRKPRWTPPIRPLAAIDPLAPVSGEIDLDRDKS